MKIRIRVTDEHIRLGCRGDTLRCPVARAITARFSPQANIVVNVYKGAVSLRLGPLKEHWSPLSKRVQDWIEDYDYDPSSGVCQPFQFMLNIPDSCKEYTR